METTNKLQPPTRDPDHRRCDHGGPPPNIHHPQPPPVDLREEPDQVRPVLPAHGVPLGLADAGEPQAEFERVRVQDVEEEGGEPEGGFGRCGEGGGGGGWGGGGVSGGDEEVEEAEEGGGEVGWGGEVGDAGEDGEPGVEERVARRRGDARVEEGGEGELLGQGAYHAGGEGVLGVSSGGRIAGRGGETSVDGWWWWEGRRVGEGRGTEGMWDGGLTLRRSWLVELGGGGC